MRTTIFIIGVLFAINCNGQNFMFFGNNSGLAGVIDTSTYINLIFDSSGSMNATLEPLNTMRDDYLLDSLIGFYDNDTALYESRVNVVSESSERTMGTSMLNKDVATLSSDPDKKIVNIIYQDEAFSIYYTTPFSSSNTLTATYTSDIASLRSSTSDYLGTLRYTGVIFQVDFTDNYFKEFLQAVDGGDNNYSGTSGLSDRGSQFIYYHDITDGGTAVYYTNLLMAALRDLGFDL